MDWGFMPQEKAPEIAVRVLELCRTGISRAALFAHELRNTYQLFF